MSSDDIQIHDVSDTALWVAYYRAKESARPDALFQDKLAAVLIGERGKKIAESMAKVGRYTEWSVVSRTVIIDDFISTLIKEGVETVINLGAGLDTRPYRMNLPKDLRWIEVDYPRIINHKNTLLKSERPKCQLKRIELDLADDVNRRSLLQRLGAESKKALVLTEGVIPYLSPEQVSELARDLYAQKSFAFWITEFFKPQVYKYLQASLRTRKMQNAPFRFYPPDWLGFFAERNWIEREIRFGSEIAEKYGRKVPMPLVAIFFRLFASEAAKTRAKTIAGYVLFKRKDQV